jgi:hypothetical protein
MVWRNFLKKQGNKIRKIRSRGMLSLADALSGPVGGLPSITGGDPPEIIGEKN